MIKVGIVLVSLFNTFLFDSVLIWYKIGVGSAAVFCYCLLPSFYSQLYSSAT